MILQLALCLQGKKTMLMGDTGEQFSWHFMQFFLLFLMKYSIFVLDLITQGMSQSIWPLWR